MYKKYKNKLFLFLILLGILFSFYFVVGRMKAESQYKSYDIVADYDEFLRLSFEEDKNPKEYFEDLAKNGVSSIAVNESTIASMKNFSSSKIKTELDGDDLIVEGPIEDLNFIKEGFNSLKGNRNIYFESENKLKIEGKPSDIITYKREGYDTLQNPMPNSAQRASGLEYVGLGFDKRKIDFVKNIQGLSLNLRPTFYSKFQDPRKSMERLKNSINEMNPKQNYIIFSGKEFYKNSENDKKVVEDFTNFISENNIALGLVEASNQRGHLDLSNVNETIKKEKVKKVRAFTTWEYLASNYDYGLPMHHNGEELTNVYFRAISERNISVVYLKPFVKNDNVITDAKSYGKVLKPLEERLAPKGYEIGNVKAMGSWHVNPIFKLPVALGVVAAAILLLEIVFSIPLLLSMILFIIGCILAILFFGLAKMESTGNVIFNLGAIVSFSSLAICTIMENYNEIRFKNRKGNINKIFFHGTFILFMAICITMIGALYEISFMSGTNYLMELNIFRGVKISQILPIFLSLFIYAAYVGFGRKDEVSVKLRPRELGIVLNSNVKVWHALAGVLLLIILGIFILRGGNTSTKVPGMELLARNLMEEYLPARPRTKAIVAGFPAVIFLAYIAYKRKGEIFTSILVLLSAIGMADIVNTFSHIRTPLKVSITRVGVEFVVALVISYLGLFIIDLLRKGYEKNFD